MFLKPCAESLCHATIYRIQVLLYAFSSLKLNGYYMYHLLLYLIILYFTHTVCVFHVFPIKIVEIFFYFFGTVRPGFSCALMSDFIERAMTQAVIRRPLKRESPGSIPGHSMCVLWWTLR